VIGVRAMLRKTVEMEQQSLRNDPEQGPVGLDEEKKELTNDFERDFLFHYKQKCCGGCLDGSPCCIHVFTLTSVARARQTRTVGG